MINNLIKLITYLEKKIKRNKYEMDRILMEAPASRARKATLMKRKGSKIPAIRTLGRTER